MPQKILILEADEKIIKNIELFLNAEGYQIIFATGNTEGLKLAQTAKPDLIIINDSPKISGYFFINELKANRETQNIPNILISHSQPKSGFIMASPTPYKLAKPLNMPKLLEMVRKILRTG